MSLASFPTEKRKWTRLHFEGEQSVSGRSAHSAVVFDEKVLARVDLISWAGGGQTREDKG